MWNCDQFKVECWKITCWIARLSGSSIAAFWRIGIAAFISPFASKIYQEKKITSHNQLECLNCSISTIYKFANARTFPFRNSALTFFGWHRRTLSTDNNATSNADIFICAAAKLLYTLTRVSNNSCNWSFVNWKIWKNRMLYTNKNCMTVFVNLMTFSGKFMTEFYLSIGAYLFQFWAVTNIFIRIIKIF